MSKSTNTEALPLVNIPVATTESKVQLQQQNSSNPKNKSSEVDE